MIKGLINYKNSKIPFLIEEYQLTLFSEEELVFEFCKEYNRKKNYLLTGQCFNFGNQPSEITLLVERSIGERCYLKCYIIKRFWTERNIDTIRFESKILDDIFSYKYQFIDLARDGRNLSAEEIEVYKIPFEACGESYELNYHIGQNNKMGILDNFKMCGKSSIKLHTSDIEECYRITLLLTRFAQFLTSNSKVSFEQIKLCEGKIPIADFYCKSVSDRYEIDNEVMFYEYNVLRFTPKILNNLAIDLNSKIMNSIPLGHISDFNNRYTPKRFIDEITSFEYLFEKLEPVKAKDKKIHLRDELKLMFDIFFEGINGENIDSDKLSKCIKELRTDILHGYAYYYDFSDNDREQYYIIKLASLIQKMSLKLMGFSELEIQEFVKHIIAF